MPTPNRRLAIQKAQQLLLCFALSFCSLGCESQVRSPALLAGADKCPTINIGLVLANQAGYVCLSFDQLGLSHSDKAISIKSSCDCIQPSIVSFVKPDQSHSQAVLLSYVVEPTASESTVAPASDSVPVNLGVRVELKLANGRTQEFVLNFLHTHLVDKGQS